MKRIYIAGKVSGLPIEEVITKFHKKQMELINDGHTVINPVELIGQINAVRENKRLEPLVDKYDRKQIMRICIIELLNCHEVHLLHDWEHSKGALEEIGMALKYGIKIIYPKK